MKKVSLLLLGMTAIMAVNAQDTHYVPVTDNSQLVSGDEYILVGNSAESSETVVYYAMGTQIASNTRANGVAVEVSENGDITSLPENAMVLTLEGSSDAWYLKNSDGKYLRNAEGNANYLLLVDSKSDAVPATIVLTSSENPIRLNADGLNDENKSRNCLRMYDASKNQFCFTTSGKAGSAPVTRLFKKEEIKEAVITTFTQIESLDNIIPGKKYIIVNAEDTETEDAVVMTSEINNRNRFLPATFSFSDGAISIDLDKDTKVAVVSFETADNGWCVKIGDKYLNILATGVALTENPQAITVSYSSGMFKLQSEIDGQKYTLRYTKNYATFFSAKGTTGGVSLYVDGKIDDGPTTGIESITPDSDISANTEWYTLQGIKVSEPSKGIYIRVEGKKAEKVVIR